MRDWTVGGYGDFARFYDRVMGDASDNIDLIAAAIGTWRPGASSLLELGCGTGSVLSGLGEIPRRVGIDASSTMLDLARAKVPDATFVQDDIATFELDETFDVIVCVFDTLNHLTRFEEWTSMFARVAAHLNDDGLFCFDVNTTGRLAHLCEVPPLVLDVEGATMIMGVRDDGDHLTTWDIRVFEPLDDGLYRLTREQVRELGVELDLVRSAISADFETLSEDDGAGARPSDDSVRAHFVCRRRG